MYDDTDAYPTSDAAEPPPDPRVVAMMRFVELEMQHGRAQLESERRQKQAAVAAEELRVARDDLYGALGLPSNNVKPMSREDVQREVAKRDYR